MNQKYLTNSKYCIQIMKPVLAILGSEKKIKLFKNDDILRMIQTITNSLKGAFEAKECF